MTVGVGDDMVMHMTIDNVEDLRTNMLQVLQSCRLPKVNIFFGVLFKFEWDIVFSNKQRVNRVTYDSLLVEPHSIRSIQ